MSLLVPEKATAHEGEGPLPELGEALESLRQFIGASAGWVGLRDARAGLTFPVRRGEIPESWLRLQQSRDSVWGFAVREGPTLLNDLKPWTALGEPPLRNLLSCPLGEGDKLYGHVALINKPQGFASHDAAVLQGMAHHMIRLLDRLQAAPSTPLSAGWRHILDRMGEGILVLDEAGTLLYANATWLAWTGFRAEDLLGRQGPFPFWVSQHDLVRAMSLAATMPASALPFRRQDQSLLWCQVETVTEQCEGRRVTVAFLQRTTEPALASMPLEAERVTPGPPINGELPFGMALTDPSGRLLWCNSALGRLMSNPIAPGQMLRVGLAPAAAAVFEHLVEEWANAEPGRMGTLILHTGDNPLSLFFVTVGLNRGTGVLLALTNEPDGFPLAPLGGQVYPLPLSHPTPSWLVLLLEADGPTDGWGQRWEKLTGLAASDVEESPSELVLDWLFPQQTDRERVADCLHQSEPQGCQLILDLTTPAGSRPLLCTFLPVPAAESSKEAGRRWLLLVGEPELFAGPGTPSRGFVHQFAQGLHQFLRHQLRSAAGSARLALEHTDLPADVTNWFRGIDVSCHSIETLLEDLVDLARESAGERRVLSMADLVREFCDERTAGQPRPNYELRMDLSGEPTLVRVNNQLLRGVLRRLWTNAEQALTNGLRRIEVRVRTSGDTVRCEIQDTGVGLPIDDWTLALAPFFSTKGAFASDPSHAALEGTGLGLTVSRHLLTLHEGQLELRSVPGEGTTAIILLPRADNPDSESRAAAALSDTVRRDPLSQPRGPHRHAEGSAPTRTLSTD